MKKLTKAILVLSLAFASGKCLGDWTDAGWHVWYVSTCGAGSNVVEVVNMNKLSFREYAFNRLTGALKRICWNTSKAEEFYVNGESEITLTMNGEKAKPDEGLSYVNIDGNTENKVSLKDFVDTLREELIGDYLFEKYGTWPMYSKFFDYDVPLFHHLHLGFEDAARIGVLGKPECYYYPPQYNNYPGSMPACS